VRDPAAPSHVLITVRNIPPGSRTLTVNGVADLTASVAYGATCSFNYVDVSIPAGYYDGLDGLRGSALRVALHNIIKNHTVTSYSYALTAFATTDIKPNGKIWDPYSDVPGGTPPYEYNVGQTGQGGSEGLGYNREHSFPQSWFGGASPMYSDLWILYPTDSYVNGMRANYPYGDVAAATNTSLNGSRLGSSASPGYGGTVFEPIDAFKGDLARSQFYIATRYFNEDSGWPGSPAVSGSQWLPWAAQQFLAWSEADPVGWKERMRNGAIYVIQHNRNPFVDHPEYVAAIYDSNRVAGVGEPDVARLARLRPNVPNPFGSRTTIAFELSRPAPVSLRIFDVAGRLVRVLSDGGVLAAGGHFVEWNGRDDAGAPVRTGLYLCRLEALGTGDTRRIVLTR
jgi:endonuclease I